MSWASTITAGYSTPNQSSRDGRKVTGWIIHHNAATGGAGVLQMMVSGSKQVSANYQVMQDGRVMGVVPRELRSWSASNAAWDGSSLTFEIANDSGAPGWTISEAAYVSVARTIAEDARWAGIPINRTTVRGHREGSALGDGGSYSTACPGGIDLDRLVTLAQKYAGSSTASGGVTALFPEEDDMSEMYLKAPNGAVVHLHPRVKVTFRAAEEYDNWRSIVATNNSEKSGSSVQPPALESVHGVSWGGFVQACQHFGVDPERDTDGTRSLTEADVAAIAAMSADFD